MLEKILCNFLDQWTAQIRFGDFISEKFPLESGVPQGSILSPTLYIYYTSDLTPARAGGTDVLFADDITQIVEYEGRSKKFLARRTQREIERINLYEKKWKIKTNQSKFKILSIFLLLILGLIVRAPLLSRIERERIDHIKFLLLSSLMLLLFLLGIAVLLSFVEPVHLSVKGKLISSTLLLLKNVSSPYPKKSSITSVTLAFPHLFALMAL